MRRHATTYVLFAAVALGFAALAALLLPSSSARAVQAAPPAAAAPAPSAFLVELVGPGTEVPANAAELTLAADRVCEGITAQVPVVVMADTLVAELSLTDEEARHLVNTAATFHCAPDAR